MTAEFVLGLGGCVDVEVDWDTAVLQQLVDEYRVATGEASHEIEVRDERDLVASILGFLRAGRGGERFVAASDIVERFAARFTNRFALGGTAVRAGLAMAKLGFPSALHLVSIDDNVRRLLPPECSYICSAVGDSLDPHLIVQYPPGTRIRCSDGDIVTPQPNRLIYVNDRPNREMRLSPELPQLLAGARVFLLASLNTMQDERLLRSRLRQVRADTRHLPKGALVVHEDAAYHRPQLRAVVREGLAGIVDVHGMNEDELQSYLRRSVDLLDPDDVCSALVELRQTINAPTVVVHTQHWALTAGRDAARFAPALRGGITMAATRYRCGDGFSADDYQRTATLTPMPAAADSAAEITRRSGGTICALPAPAVAVDQPTTVGLGDAFVGGFICSLPSYLRGE